MNRNKQRQLFSNSSEGKEETGVCPSQDLEDLPKCCDGEKSFLKNSDFASSQFLIPLLQKCQISGFWFIQAFPPTRLPC